MFIELFFVLLSLYLVWFASNSSDFPSYQFVFCLSYFLYIYFGYLLMSMDSEHFGTNQFQTAGKLIRGGYWSIFVAAMLTVRIKSISNRFVSERYQVSSDYGSVTICYYKIIGMLCLIAVVAYGLLIPINPLRVMFVDPAHLAVAREAVTVNFDNFGFFSNIFYNIMPLAWCSLFFLNKRNSAYFLMVVNLLVILMTGQKSPVVYIGILYLFLHGFLNNKFPYKKAIFFGLMGIILLVLIVFVQNTHLLSGFNYESLEASFNGLMRRIFYVGPRTILNYCEVFPTMHPFLSIEPYSAPSDQIVYQAVYQNGIKGTVNSVSVALFYALFGSVFIASVLMFFVSIILFLFPILFSSLFRNQTLFFAVWINYYLLMVKMVMTDWYTLLPAFLIIPMALQGGVHLFRFSVKSLMTLRVARVDGDIVGVSLTLLAFMYFFQGQLRGLLN